MNKRINEPKSYGFPKWDKWSSDMAKKLNHYCGSLMENLNYGNEPEWKSLLKKK